MKREAYVPVRMSSSGREALARLAVERGLTVSDVVRLACQHYLACPKGGGGRV